MSDHIHPTSPADLLRIPIADLCREAGHDDLAGRVVEIAGWIDLARPIVRSANIAGEDIRMGDVLSRGTDELLYRTRSPVPVEGVAGVARYDQCRGERVYHTTPREYRTLLDGSPREIDEHIDRAFRAAMERTTTR